MSIYALADLHLAFGVPEKSMEYFGEVWALYTERIEEAWRNIIKPEDLVLIAGDISWAKTEAEASHDLEWIDQLPGTKLIIKGNHDYWWPSLARLKKLLPPSLHAIQNDIFNWGEFSIGGARLWDTHEYNFNGYVQMIDNPRAKKDKIQEDLKEQEKIFLREMHRLELSLQMLKPSSKKIAMTHYPPIGPEMLPSRVSKVLENFGVDTCVFGHLHNIKKDKPLFGTQRGVRYILTSADYLNFTPLQIY